MTKSFIIWLIGLGFLASGCGTSQEYVCGASNEPRASQIQPAIPKKASFTGSLGGYLYTSRDLMHSLSRQSLTLETSTEVPGQLLFNDVPNEIVSPAPGDCFATLTVTSTGTNQVDMLLFAVDRPGNRACDAFIKAVQNDGLVVKFAGVPVLQQDKPIGKIQEVTLHLLP